MEKQYYVYGLFDGDECFYIGKGKGARKDLHYITFCRRREAVNRLLLYKFINMEEGGRVPVSRIFKDNISSVDAFALEVELIDRYGQLIKQTGRLCNVNIGGNAPPTALQLRSYYTENQIKEIFKKRIEATRRRFIKKRKNDIKTMKRLLKLNMTVKYIANTVGVTPDTILRWAKTFNIYISGEGKRIAIINHLRSLIPANKNKIQKTAKTYTVKEPSGNIITTKKLKVYCTQKNIDYSNLRRTALPTKSGKIRYTKGYTILRVEG